MIYFFLFQYKSKAEYRSACNKKKRQKKSGRRVRKREVIDFRQGPRQRYSNRISQQSVRLQKRAKGKYRGAVKEASSAAEADLELLKEAKSTKAKEAIFEDKCSDKRMVVRKKTADAFKKAELAIKLLTKKDEVDATCNADVEFKRRDPKAIVLSGKLYKK